MVKASGLQSGVKGDFLKLRVLRFVFSQGFADEIHKVLFFIITDFD